MFNKKERFYVDMDEHRKIARELEKHHAIFERVWAMSRIRFTRKISTAAVFFNKEGELVDFAVNPEFWDKLSFIHKCFVLAHECLHIALNHGRRSSALYKEKHKMIIANIAQDLVNNHALVNLYGFDRDEIDALAPITHKDGRPFINPETGEQVIARKYCWVENFFKPEDKIRDDENFEYYYNRLLREYEKNKENMQNKMDQSQTVDEHDVDNPSDGEGEGSEGEGKDKEDFDYIDLDDPNLSDDFSPVIDKLNGELTDDEKKDIEKLVKDNDKSNKSQEGKTPSGEEGSPAGNSPGSMWTFAKKRPIKKRKWESIVTNWSKKRLKETSREIDQFVFPNRRFSAAIEESELMLPSSYEVWDKFKEPDLIDVWFFQDTSGSCSGYTDRFFAIAEAMPLDRFRMRLFCFDTEVYETSLESRKLYGFGGTMFNILEERIQQELQRDPKFKYPDAVFVVTDGEGNGIRPEKAKNWHWILTPSGTRRFIPNECNFYDLTNYE